MANDTVGQWNGSAAHLRKRKKKPKHGCAALSMNASRPKACWNG